MYIQADLKTKSRRSGNCNQLKAVFPASSQMTPFWRSCRHSDYAEHTQVSVAAPLPLTGSTRHNPALGIRPVKSASGRSRAIWDQKSRLRPRGVPRFRSSPESVKPGRQECGTLVMKLDRSVPL
jgi:hypothetical protein